MSVWTGGLFRARTVPAAPRKPASRAGTARLRWGSLRRRGTCCCCAATPGASTLRRCALATPVVAVPNSPTQDDAAAIEFSCRHALSEAEPTGVCGRRRGARRSTACGSTTRSATSPSDSWRARAPSASGDRPPADRLPTALIDRLPTSSLDRLRTSFLAGLRR